MATADTHGTVWLNERCTFLSPAVYGTLALRCNHACCTVADDDLALLPEVDVAGDFSTSDG